MLTSQGVNGANGRLSSSTRLGSRRARTLWEKARRRWGALAEHPSLRLRVCRTAFEGGVIGRWLGEIFVPLDDDNTPHYGELLANLVDLELAALATSVGLLGCWASLARGCGERAAAALTLLAAKPERPEDLGGLGWGAGELLDAYAAYVRGVATLPRNGVLRFACELDSVREQRRQRAAL